jgi:hypothetical protein
VTSPPAPRRLDAWNDVLYLCDTAGIRTVREFDARFPLTQSVFNWCQDLEMELGNAGNAEPRFHDARVGVCTEYLRRFGGEDSLVTENFHRALAESHFELGETGKTDELYESWLAADPRWGWGWIGWSDCYESWGDRAGDPVRAEAAVHRRTAQPPVRANRPRR